MKERGLSLRELANRAGIPHETLKSWLYRDGNKGEPPISDAIRLADVFELPMDQIFRGIHAADQKVALHIVEAMKHISLSAILFISGI